MLEMITAISGAITGGALGLVGVYHLTVLIATVA